jgi:hypothetical protein
LYDLSLALQPRSEIMDDDLELVVEGATPSQPIRQRLRL